MFTISIDVRGLEGTERATRRLETDLPDSMADAAVELITNASVIARTIAQTELPSGGGTYAESFSVEGPRVSPNRVSVRLINTHKWAQAVELGTRAHSGQPRFHVPPEKVRTYPWVLKPDKTGWINFQKHRGARRFEIIRKTADALRMALPQTVGRYIRDIIGRFYT